MLFSGRCPGRFRRSLGFALRGIARLIQTQCNARIHLAATLMAVGCGLFFSISALDWLWIALSISLVWITESLNTAIEFLADRITKESDPLIRDAKDLAAGAVLLSAAFSLIVGIIIFIPYLLALFRPGH